MARSREGIWEYIGQETGGSVVAAWTLLDIEGFTGVV